MGKSVSTAACKGAAVHIEAAVVVQDGINVSTAACKRPAVHLEAAAVVQDRQECV